ncbi:SMP-30/gluconolactonase/LRE family protein [Longimicrobium terrae]|uniref:SMP-30/Gluconolactonase/LRE-like region domain-containing protein n=1 Tax=Longimicrobium terrae TaxID=1639882 RepID=A0A841GX96_9BACT|nr:SMP-30/gluconolactonase/LRE family protein [Longimicrobium terrae]MBB4635252.1 hypothetical protein [Longimicrobium terrae]MBB6069646.1 hypothetical protein [Longimicrobium terrae]NNC31143.1 hypothetical protein [Longimicrobium terrae]
MIRMVLSALRFAGAALLLSVLPLAAQTDSATAAVAADSADAAADSSWREHVAAGDQARDAGDWGTWRYHLVRVREQIGYHPLVVLALARADTRLGRTEDALGWLRAYAAAGLTHDLAGDTTLAALRDTPGWSAVVERLAANARPVSAAQTAFIVPDSQFLPESVVFDARSSRFFLSSLRHGSILSWTADGGFREFAAGGGERTWSTLALAVDTLTRTLWATTAALPLYERYQAADSGKSAVLAYDLETGALRRRYDAPEEGRHTLGDMTVGPDGTVYVSDADGGTVYRITRGGEELEAWVGDEFASPQGLVAAADGRRVYVADYLRGIAVVDTSGEELAWLQTPDSITVAGIDGLVRAGNRLIAVQNGITPKRVVEFTLNTAGTAITGWRALEAGSPLLTEPTHAVVIGGEVFFIPDSGWDRLDEAGNVKPGMTLEPAHVLRVALPGR